MLRPSFGFVLVAALTCLAGAAEAQSQRAPMQEHEGRGRSCSDVEKRCLGAAGAQLCASLKQECVRTGTWQSRDGVIRNLERR